MHETILFEIDAELARLHITRAKLLRQTTSEAKKAGRPGKKALVESAHANGGRVISDEGRERIRKAQFKRWAAVRKLKRAALKAAGATPAAVTRTTRRKSA